MTFCLNININFLHFNNICKSIFNLLSLLDLTSAPGIPFQQLPVYTLRHQDLEGIVQLLRRLILYATGEVYAFQWICLEK